MFPRAAGAFSKQTETSRTPLIIVLGFLMIIRLFRPLNFVFWKYHFWGVLYHTSTFKYTLYLRSWNFDLDFPTKEGALAALLPNRSRHAGWRTHDLVWWWRRITVADDIWDHMVYLVFAMFETVYFAVSVNCICQILNLHFSRSGVMMTLNYCRIWYLGSFGVFGICDVFWYLRHCILLFLWTVLV